MQYNGMDKATKAQVKNARIVNNLLDVDDVEKICDAIGKYLLASGDERKKCYNKVFRIAKYYGVTVEMLSDWYTTDLF